MGESYQTVPNVNDLVDGHPKELRLMLDEERRAGALVKVVGVGGGGGNAVSRMVQAGFEGVQFLVANTDLQALQANPAPVKLQIGSKLQGPRRGRRPERRPPGRRSNTDKLIQALDGADMVFVTTGLGGDGNRRGSRHREPRKRARRPHDCRVTKPFKFEGRKRQTQASGPRCPAGLCGHGDRDPNERLLAIIIARPPSARRSARPTMC